jgi:vacuolar-type H+-ATPase subunit C/Vma6
MEEKDNTQTEKNEHKIDITLDEFRYNSLLDLCNKYTSEKGKGITPKEYILMLVDSAISSIQGSKGE